MKLQGITSVNYNISEDLKDFHIDRVIREISEGVAPTVASWYILNESTNRYDIDKLLLNEGIKELLAKGASKVNDALLKGYSDLDAIKTKVVQGLKGKGDPGLMSKLGDLAKKNAKYVKPALMVAVVGASLLGMDTASANEVMSGFEQYSGNEMQEFMNYQTQSQEELAKFAGSGGGGADAGQNELDAATQGGGTGGGGEDGREGKFGGIIDDDGYERGGGNSTGGGQAPQEDQPAQYGQDKQPNATNDAQQQQPRRTEVSSQSSSSTVQSDGKGGFVDQNGKAVNAPPSYSNAKGFRR